MLVPESVIIDWTLVDDDWRLVGAKRGAARLGFALLMRYFRLHGRFPRSRRDLPTAAVGYVARQLRVPSASIREYQWSGRTIESHRAQIRAELGFREATRDDEARLVAWLAAELARVERSNERVVEALRSRCRQERIEPPARVDRMIASARATATAALCERTVQRLPGAVTDRLERLVEPSQGWRGALGDIKAGGGRPSLETLLAEVRRLETVRAIGLPADLFGGVPDAQLAAWRARAAAEYPSDLRRHTQPLRLTLLAVLCACRQREITDRLVELLIGLVHKVNTRAERRVEGELLNDLRRVRGKHGLLFRLAEAAVDHPDETVRTALYPVVGEATLRDLVREAKANEGAFRYLRRATARLVNATLAVRDPALWGSGTACASDSKRFGSWSGNLMTEWHARYGGPGVMIYWHVERKSLCVYSQLKSCSTSSEVAAMIEGVLRHGTDADIDRNYVDSHGHVVTWTPPALRVVRSRPGLRWGSSGRCLCGCGCGHTRSNGTTAPPPGSKSCSPTSANHSTISPTRRRTPLRCPHKVLGRVRLHRAAGLPAAAPAEEHRQSTALPARRHRDVAEPDPGADPPDPLGPDCPAVRPDGQVRDRAAAGHR